jgi:hypothetical protein
MNRELGGIPRQEVKPSHEDIQKERRKAQIDTNFSEVQGPDENGVLRDVDGQELITDDEFARDLAEAEKELARANENVEKTNAHLEESGARGDTIAKTVQKVAERVQATETKAAEKIGIASKVLAATVKETVDSFAAPNFIVEGVQNFAHDMSDAVIGTSLTDRMKIRVGWFFGRQNAEPRTGNEQHRGVREIPAALADEARLFSRRFLKELVQIPADLARQLDTWSPNAIHERQQLAKEMEQRAAATRDRILDEMRKEADKIYLEGLSNKNMARIEELRDRSDNARTEYEHEAKEAKDLAPGFVERTLGQSARAGITFALDTLSHTVGVGHIVREAGQSFSAGIRGERRKRFAARSGNAPYSADASRMRTAQERPMGTMERLGDWMMGKALEMQTREEKLLASVEEEVAHTKQMEASIFQDVISQRIEALTEKTKITAADRKEIAKLAVNLARAQRGLLAAREIGSAIAEVRALGARKPSEAQKEDENLLLGYLSGRTINTLRKLNIIPLAARNALITELQNNPSREALQAAESIVYAALDENARVSGMGEITPEQRQQLEEAQKTLEDGVRRATDLYEDSLASVSAEMVKAFQAAGRELKKANAATEAAKGEQRAAA